MANGIIRFRELIKFVKLIFHHLNTRRCAPIVFFWMLNGRVFRKNVLNCRLIDSKKLVSFQFGITIFKSTLSMNLDMLCGDKIDVFSIYSSCYHFAPCTQLQFVGFNHNLVGWPYLANDSLNNSILLAFGKPTWKEQ